MFKQVMKNYFRHKYVNCSDCFKDEGLRIDASFIGNHKKTKCNYCNSSEGKKLNQAHLEILAHRYFVKGSTYRGAFGSAPAIEFNHYQKTSAKLSQHLREDVNIFEKSLQVGFFDYGPRLWMLGEIEPLKDLCDESKRKDIINKILNNYPIVELDNKFKFYRIRKNPEFPENHLSYDSPPDEHLGKGRLDSKKLPILYGSVDISTCIHECRVTYEDELYIATLSPLDKLRLLDLSEILIEKDCVSEFESLDIAVFMLFGAGAHSYEILREVAHNAFENGFDGIIYPSYFTDLRTGLEKITTTFGIAHRRIPEYRKILKKQIVSNIALFNQPIKNEKVRVSCINRLVLNRADYHFSFGPVYSPFELSQSDEIG